MDHSIELSFGLDEKRQNETRRNRACKGNLRHKDLQRNRVRNKQLWEIFLPDFDFDLIIASVHEDALNYFDRIIKCIDGNEVHVIGHLLSDMFEFSRNEKLEEILLDRLEELEIALELNSNHRCPPDDFLMKCADRNLKISIGSDAHRLEKVGKVNWSLEKAKSISGVPRFWNYEVHNAYSGCDNSI